MANVYIENMFFQQMINLYNMRVKLFKHQQKYKHVVSSCHITWIKMNMITSTTKFQST